MCSGGGGVEARGHVAAVALDGVALLCSLGSGAEEEVGVAGGVALDDAVAEEGFGGFTRAGEVVEGDGAVGADVFVETAAAFAAAGGDAVVAGVFVGVAGAAPVGAGVGLFV